MIVYLDDHFDRHSAMQYPKVNSLIPKYVSQLSAICICMYKGAPESSIIQYYYTDHWHTCFRNSWSLFVCSHGRPPMNSVNERCLLIEIIIVFLNIIMGMAKNYMYRVISPVHMYNVQYDTRCCIASCQPCIGRRMLQRIN